MLEVSLEIETPTSSAVWESAGFGGRRSPSGTLAEQGEELGAERGAHEVVDREVDRGVDHLEAPDDRWQVQEPDRVRELPLLPTVLGKIHSHGLIPRKKESEIRYLKSKDRI